MKKIIILCVATVIAASSNAYSTPILELDNKTDDQVILYDILPLEFTRYDDAKNIPEDLNLNFDELTSDDSFSEFALASHWTPTWYDDFNWDWWFDWFDWTFVFPPCPIFFPPPGNNPNPVPEPATMLLFGTGLVGLAIFARRETKK